MEQIKDAIRIVLFLGIIHRPATAYEIALAVNLPRSRIIPVLYRLKAAHIVSLATHRRKSYELQVRAEPVTLEDVEQAMKEGKLGRMSRLHRIKNWV